LEALLRKVIDGDARAWHELWDAVQPTLWAITGKWQITGPLSQRDDDRRNIVVDVMQRLRVDGFRRLRSYLASLEAAPAARAGSFKTWLATVTARTAIDYVRAHPEYRDARGRDDASEGADRWVRIVPLAGEPVQPAADPTKVATAAVLLERARAELRPEQLSALYLWLQGDDHVEIAARLGLGSPREADRLVRAALKRLRDRYSAPRELRPSTELESPT
jgi:DNA-directed RNA polymerase specialized sigma24 family protein